MIEFVTLFLGLISGPRLVQVSVLDPVAYVEVRLDGRTVGFMESPPWQLEVELGAALRPHRLEAVAFDARREEVGRVEQLLNLPRSRTELKILVEPPRQGAPRRGRLVWFSVDGDAPTRLEVTLDGEPLAVQALRAFELPAQPAGPAVHVLSADADFPGGQTAHATLLLGGDYGEVVTSQLTSVPVRLAPDTELPPVSQLGGWLVEGGEPLEVMAVEDRRAEVVVVRDRGVWDELLDLGHRFRTPTQRAVGTLGPRRVIRLLDAIAQPRGDEGRRTNTFPLSQPFTEGYGGMPLVVGTYYRDETNRPRSDRKPAPQRLADAVATAAMTAAGSQGGRAVVVILGSEAEETSQWPVAVVRDYLAALGVPLYVWTPIRDPERRAALVAGSSPWGAAEDVSDHPHLLDAVARLRHDLDLQRVLWVRGEHFLHDLELSDRAAGARLVR